MRAEAATIYDFRLTVPLDRFDLNVEYKGSKRVLGVFGVSGAGKSTLLECLAGLRKEEKGSIAIGGEAWLDTENSQRLKAMDRRVGYVPQDHLLFPHRSVRGNLEAGKARAVKSGLDFEAVMENVVSVLELEPLLDRAIDQLSGGECQRVALGRALCSGPRLLLLDEPLASLDAQLRRKILPFLIRARDAFDLPMVIVSHNPVELQVLCDEVIVLERGAVTRVGSPSDLFASGTMFEVAKAHGFENVFSGTIVEKSSQVDRMLLPGTSAENSIQIPTTRSATGETIVASLGSDNILIGLERPIGLSARNCLPALIERMEETESRWLVHAAVSSVQPNFIVEVTLDAIEALPIKTGARVYLVFKTSSVSTLSD